VELTRKRQGQSIYELFGHSCPTCSGLGLLAHLPGETTSKPAETMPRLDKAIQLDLDDRDMGLSGGTEANLVSHTSYQEVRSNGSSRRRRRSSKDSDKPSSTSSSTATREQPTKVIPAPASKSNNKPAASSETPEPQIDRADRNDRPSKRESSKTKQDNAPEPIIVEMTPEEQEAYAHMGISPLILLGGDVKDARNAIVTVALPGMAQQVKADSVSNNGTSNGNSDLSSKNDQATGTKPSSVATNSADTSASKSREIASGATASPSSVQVDQSAQPEATTADTAEQPEKQEAQTIQSPAASRRRRRTSASS
jgi:ribonuclease E